MLRRGRKTKSELERARAVQLLRMRAAVLAVAALDVLGCTAAAIVHGPSLSLVPLSGAGAAILGRIVRNLFPPV
jgi:hypothetical protein